MKIKLIFACGHTSGMDEKVAGDMNSRPTCPLDGSPLARVEAPKPNFTIAGAANGN